MIESQRLGDYSMIRCGREKGVKSDKRDGIKKVLRETVRVIEGRKVNIKKKKIRNQLRMKFLLLFVMLHTRAF